MTVKRGGTKEGDELLDYLVRLLVDYPTTLPTRYFA